MVRVVTGRRRAGCGSRLQSSDLLRDCAVLPTNGRCPHWHGRSSTRRTVSPSRHGRPAHPPARFARRQFACLRLLEPQPCVTDPRPCVDQALRHRRRRHEEGACDRRGLQRSGTSRTSGASGAALSWRTTSAAISDPRVVGRLGTLDDPVDRLSRIAHRAARPFDDVQGRLHERADLARRGGRPSREQAHLGSHHAERASCLARAGRFDHGIRYQQTGSGRDLVDHAQDPADAVRSLLLPFHPVVDPTRRFAVAPSHRDVAGVHRGAFARPLVVRVDRLGDLADRGHRRLGHRGGVRGAVGQVVAMALMWSATTVTLPWITRRQHRNTSHPRPMRRASASPPARAAAGTTRSRSAATCPLS